MSNQVDSVWRRVPDLHSRVIELTAAGMRGQSLAAEISRIAGRHLTSSAIWAHVKRCNGSCHIDTRTTVERLTEPEGGYAASVTAPPTHKHQTGWEPGVQIDGDAGILITTVTDNADPERDALLTGSDLNPAEWQIVGDLAFNKWQTPVPIDNIDACACTPKIDGKHYESRWNYQYKARLRRVNAKRAEEIAQLVDEIRTHVPVPFDVPKGDDALVVAISDTQAGKSDGDGSSGMVGRFLAGIDAFERRVSDLRKIGRGFGPLYIFGLGDLIESCDGHYPQQAFRAELNRRDQINIMRRLIMKAIERWSPLFEQVVVAAVGGNHGENRKDGKSFTDFADNDDVAIFDQIEDIVSSNPAAYGHVSFRIPQHELSLTLDVAGEIVGLTHGHITGKARAAISSKIKEASSPARRVIDWWAAQAHGKQPIGDARILFTGHYHHLLVTESGTKTHIQVPALDGGSDWWRNISGQDARPGLCSLRIGKNVSEAGWGDLEII